MPRDSDVRFAAVAVRAGHAREEDVRACFAIQERLERIGLEIPIGEILRENGFLDQRQVIEIVAEVAAARAAEKSARGGEPVTPSAGSPPAATCVFYRSGEAQAARLASRRAFLTRREAGGFGGAGRVADSPEPVGAGPPPDEGIEERLLRGVLEAIPSAAASPPPVPIPTDHRSLGDRFGKYRVLAKLGQGGMAEVYKAYEPTTGRAVALKVLRQDLAGNEVFVRRFCLEACRTLLVDHPNVVRLYEVGAVLGRHYFTMECLEGETLRDRLSSRGELPEREVLAMLRQLASGLDEIHRRGLVHCDLKPNNLIVLPTARVDGGGGARPGPGGDAGDGEVVKILDFGLARTAGKSARDGDLADGKTFLGTAKYVAPELVLPGASVDGRADIFSLGIAAYQMLAGEAPFRAERSIDYIEANLRAEAAPVAEANPRVSSRTSRLIAAMMAKAASDRPTAAELLCVAARIEASPEPDRSAARRSGEKPARRCAVRAAAAAAEAAVAAIARRPVPAAAAPLPPPPPPPPRRASAPAPADAHVRSRPLARSQPPSQSAHRSPPSEPRALAQQGGARVGRVDGRHRPPQDGAERGSRSRASLTIIACCALAIGSFALAALFAFDAGAPARARAADRTEDAPGEASPAGAADPATGAVAPTAGPLPSAGQAGAVERVASSAPRAASMDERLARERETARRRSVAEEAERRGCLVEALDAYRSALGAGGDARSGGTSSDVAALERKVQDLSHRVEAQRVAAVYKTSLERAVDAIRLDDWSQAMRAVESALDYRPDAAEAQALRRLVLPRFRAPAAMVYVPGDASGGLPFYLDGERVTNAQYLRFLQASANAEDPPPPVHWRDGLYPAGQSDHPVRNATVASARAYARWAGKALPTAPEELRAARLGLLGGEETPLRQLVEVDLARILGPAYPKPAPPEAPPAAPRAATTLAARRSPAHDGLRDEDVLADGFRCAVRPAPGDRAK